jgi:hypothetical protein
LSGLGRLEVVCSSSRLLLVLTAITKMDIDTIVELEEVEPYGLERPCRCDSRHAKERYRVVRRPFRQCLLPRKTYHWTFALVAPNRQ